MTEDERIGKKIREFRTEVKKMTQKAFSEMLDTTQANMSQIEKGKCQPSGQFINRLIKNFPDINLHWIFFDEGLPLRSKTKIEEKQRSKEKLNEYSTKLKKFHALNTELTRTLKQKQKLEEDNHKLINLLSSKK